MKLRTKLFLFTTLLLLLMTLVLFIAPEIEMAIHFGELNKEVQAQVEQVRLQQQQHNLEWLQSEIDSAQSVINATLYMVNEYPTFYNAFAPPNSAIATNSLTNATMLLAYSPSAEYIQNTQNGVLSSLITLGRINLYNATRIFFSEELAWIVLDVPSPAGKGFEQEAYLGIPLRGLDHQILLRNTTFQTRTGMTEQGSRLLYDPSAFLALSPAHFDNPELLNQAKQMFPDPQDQQAFSQFLNDLKTAYAYLTNVMKSIQSDNSKEVRELLAKKIFARQVPLAEEISSAPAPQQNDITIIAPQNKGTPFQPTSGGAFSKDFASVVIRSDELSMIFHLGNILEMAKKLSNGAFKPCGMSMLQAGNQGGEGLLANDAIQSQILFDDAAHYEKYHPSPGSIPIATTFAILPPEVAGKLSMVNTLQLETASINSNESPHKGYLSIGTDLIRVVESLAQVTGEISILVYKQNPIYAFDPERNELGSKFKDLFPVTDALNQSSNSGIITFNNVQYFYTKYQPIPAWDVYFFNIIEAKKALAFITAFLTESQDTVRALSRHLVFVALSLFIVGLILAEVIARQISKPLTTLAKATDKVLKGRYDQVELPSIAPEAKDEVSMLSRSFNTMVKGLQDRERIRDILNKVVSKEIAEEILKGKVHLGGEVHNVTIFFADIRHFTTLTQDIPPEEVIAFLNDYMTQMTEIIESHGGVIDKYVGDEIMALYGAPIANQHSAIQAVVSALLMIDKLKEWNSERVQRGAFPIEVGFGINHGPVLAGNMGTELRLNYTVLGANVNLAARLCTEAAGMEILIPKWLVDEPLIADTIIIEEATSIWLKGFTTPTSVCRIKGFKPGIKPEELDIWKSV